MQERTWSADEERVLAKQAGHRQSAISADMLKPRARVNGLVQFQKDVPEHFSLEEQRLLSASDAGQVIATAIVKCEGLNRKYRDAVREFKTQESTNDHETVAQKQEVVLKKLKYADCLAYTCLPERWKQYNACWRRTAGNLSPAQLLNIRENGKLELICRSDRESLERGVSDLVSGAIISADSQLLQDDPFTC